ncbi:MAG: helix-turn-helix domain-containing protein [Gammaproteobacteria bacterium]|nr:helix-turn-helix domain-containing protein [Gammaproteobacteria bacterium]
MSLGARLKELRLNKGVSLQAVADAVEASKPHIWELERGTTKNPSLELISKLASYFGVTVDYLAGTGAKEEDAEYLAFAREAEEKGFSVNDLQKMLELAVHIRNTDKDD